MHPVGLVSVSLLEHCVFDNKTLITVLQEHHTATVFLANAMVSDHLWPEVVVMPYSGTEVADHK